MPLPEVNLSPLQAIGFHHPIQDPPMKVDLQLSQVAAGAHLDIFLD